jgi:hypothetical protein
MLDNSLKVLYNGFIDWRNTDEIQKIR